MHDAASVRGRDRAAGLSQKVEYDVERERRALADELAQRDAFDELHDEVGAAVGERPKVIDVHGVRVFEHRGGASLARKPGDERLVVDEGSVQDLDGDGAFQLQMRPGVDLAHAAASKQSLDLVLPVKNSADQVVGRGHRNSPLDNEGHVRHLTAERIERKTVLCADKVCK